MDVLVQHIPKPHMTNAVECIVLAMHVQFLHRGFQAHIPHGSRLDEALKLPNTYNQQANTWVIGYTHRTLSAKLEVIWALWGDKLLLTLHELLESPNVDAKEGDPDTILTPNQFFQFGVNTTKYVADHESQDSVCDWAELKRVDQLFALFEEYIDPFIAKCEAAPGDVAPTGSDGGTRSITATVSETIPNWVLVSGAVGALSLAGAVVLKRLAR